jgi:hypothetical protein
MTAPTLARTSSGAVRVPFAYAHGYDAIAIQIWHRLRTHRGSALEDVARGLPWGDWLTRLVVPLAEIEGAVRAQVVLVPGVVAIERVAATVVDGVITCEVLCRIQVRGRPFGIGVTVADPYQTSGPPLYWQTLA